MSGGEIGWDTIYEAVEQLVDEYDLTEPPVDPRGLTRKMGIPVLRFSDIDLASLEPGERNRLEHIYGAYIPDLDGPGTIYVRDGLPPFKDKDTVSHELGHAALRHHRELLLLGRAALGPEVRQIMEEEARAFSIVLRLMGDRFDREASEYVYGLATAQFLARRYELSYEMAFRRYVYFGQAGPILRIFDLNREWADMDSLEARLKYKYFVKPRSGSKFWVPETSGVVLPADHELCAALSALGKADVPVTVSGLLAKHPCNHEVIATRQRLYVLTRPC